MDSILFCVPLRNKNGLFDGLDVKSSIAMNVNGLIPTKMLATLPKTTQMLVLKELNDIQKTEILNETDALYGR